MIATKLYLMVISFLKKRLLVFLKLTLKKPAFPKSNFPIKEGGLFYE